MDILAAYLVKSVALSGALSAYYYLFLRNRKFHTFNRCYLILAVVISLVLPCLHFALYTIRKPLYIPAYLLNQPIPASEIEHQAGTLFSPGNLAAGFSLLVSLVLLVFLGARILWIYRVRKRFPGKKMEGITLIETNIPQAPFSFLKNLFWKQDIPYQSGVGADIFKHELTHILQLHTYDKLFLQIARCIFWMNPFLWLIQRELNLVHEFLADESAIHEGDTASFALMLLQVSSNGKQFVEPSHFFSQSPIKRRLAMISLSSPSRSWRKILALPFGAAIVTLSSVSLGHAQSEKDTGLEKARITIVHFEDKRPSGDAPGDSVLTMKVQLIRPNGTRDTLIFRNVHFSDKYSGVEERLSDVKHELNAQEAEARMKEKREAEGKQEVQIGYANMEKEHPSAEETEARMKEKREGEHGHESQINYAAAVKEHPSVEEITRWVESIVKNPPDFLYYLDGKVISRDQVKSLDPSKIKTANIFSGPEAVAKYGQAAGKGVVLFTTDNPR